MKKYILDTNLFFNLEIEMGLGKNPKEIIENLTNVARELAKHKKAEFFMPPRILDEFFSFVEKDSQEIKSFLGVIHVQSPDVAASQVSAEIFYKFVEETRFRSYRGLQVAEEELLNAIKHMEGKTELKGIEFQKTVGEDIKKLRDRYRQATRVKFLDSLADLDIIMLAKQLDGFLVSSDEGVLKWGRLFGVKEVIPQVFQQQLNDLLAHPQSPA